ncbi:MAG: YfiR family protein, partial [bacterium]|nr:YfiR family protein [bacterium]
MLKQYFSLVRLVVLILLVCITIPTSADNALGEYKAKSIFIYSLCKHTEWPARENGNLTSPIVISVLGKLPAGNEIQLSDKKKIGDRKVVLRKIKKLKEIDGSSVLFIASSEADRIREIIDYI